VAINPKEVGLTQSPLIVALDVDSKTHLSALLHQLDSSVCRVKIGKEVFTALGPEAVTLCHAAGFDVFLDLKFHDIPNTCANAVRAAAHLGVWMVNVHCSGGTQMMQAARAAISQSSHQPLLIGVTVLTSMHQADLDELGINRAVDAHVDHMTGMAVRSGLDGVVCSAQEAQRLRSQHGSSVCLVTPGIRPLWAPANDQVRVVTPADALAAGASYLVVGRPITAAEDPHRALHRLVDEL
jgi:orotidine-5'-phosphate decarboxylase